MRISDRAIGVISIIVCVYLASLVWNTRFETKALPLVCLFLLIVLSTFLIVRSNKSYTFENVKSIMITFALLILYIIALNTLGFIMATILFLSAFVVINGYDGSRILGAAFCLLLPLLLYAVFKMLFDVELPQGIL